MNPHTPNDSSITALLRSLIRHRDLTYKLARMDFLNRYKGSFIGLGWSLLIPVLMLAVYTFVFSFVFNARWGENSTESRSEFALVLFAGLLIHGFFSEVFNRSPSIIIDNKNYVKKFVFPLEVLPASVIITSVFHIIISILVLFVAFLMLNGYVYWTVVFSPIVVFPLAVMCLGLSWLLAALGVFVRDIGQASGIVTTILLFMSPVFYPLSILPEELQWVMTLCNPLTFIIEQMRAVMVFGTIPDWSGLLVYTAVATFLLWLGFWFFQRTRQGFSDVL